MLKRANQQSGSATESTCMAQSSWPVWSTCSGPRCIFYRFWALFLESWACVLLVLVGISSDRLTCAWSLLFYFWLLGGKLLLKPTFAGVLYWATRVVFSAWFHCFYLSWFSFFPLFFTRWIGALVARFIFCSYWTRVSSNFVSRGKVESQVPSWHGISSIICYLKPLIITELSLDASARSARFCAFKGYSGSGSPSQYTWALVRFFK